MSVQCRTMPSQRPCGSARCARDDCHPGRVVEPTYSLTGLSERELDVIGAALTRMNDYLMSDDSDLAVAETLLERIDRMSL